MQKEQGLSDEEVKKMEVILIEPQLHCIQILWKVLNSDRDEFAAIV